jgi:hypothetical protein
VTMKDSHAEKGAHNQALIREVNERIEKLADDAAHPEFLCECADTNCVEMIELSIAEYESIRSSPVRFPIKPGHDYPEFERVVEARALRHRREVRGSGRKSGFASSSRAGLSSPLRRLQTVFRQVASSSSR